MPAWKVLPRLCMCFICIYQAVVPEERDSFIIIYIKQCFRGGFFRFQISVYSHLVVISSLLPWLAGTFRLGLGLGSRIGKEKHDTHTLDQPDYCTLAWQHTLLHSALMSQVWKHPSRPCKASLCCSSVQPVFLASLCHSDNLCCPFFPTLTGQLSLPVLLSTAHLAPPSRLTASLSKLSFHICWVEKFLLPRLWQK